MSTAKEIEDLLNESLDISYVEVRDLTSTHKNHTQKPAGQGHYKLTIAAKELEAMPLLERHRCIYRILDSLMNNKIHALSINFC
jgi:BolA family transcriptional regulator, general stress-responsive regulator